MWCGLGGSLRNSLRVKPSLGGKVEDEAVLTERNQAIDINDVNKEYTPLRMVKVDGEGVSRRITYEKA